MEEKITKSPKLDRRLSAIASMVNREGKSGMRLADIGADHGYLVTWLALEGRIAKGYACDVNEQPLERSRATVALYGAQDKVELRLTDGLHGLSPELVDWVTIAGMGGDLIARILEEAHWEKESHIRYLLQPNTKADHLRQWLLEHGYRTIEERVVEEGRFVYPIIYMTPGKMEISEAEMPLYLAAGMIGAGEKLSEEERKFLERRKSAAQLKLDGLLASKGEKSEAVIREQEAIISGISARLSK